MKKRHLFLLLYGLVLLIAPLTIWKNITALYPPHLRSNLTYINAVQRSMALIAYVALSLQIVIGAFMTRLTQKFGSFLYRFHLTQGVIIYSLILAHTLSYFLFLFIASKNFNPFYVFTDICILCQVKDELFYSLGRISFWLITFSVAVAKFRTESFLRQFWRYGHMINYVVFTLITIHARFIGTDVLSPPYVYLFYSSVILGWGVIFYKIFKYVKTNFMKNNTS